MEHDMSKIENLMDEFIGKLKPLINRQKELIHFEDSSIGLWCIDRNPKEVSKEWIEQNAFQLGVDVETKEVIEEKWWPDAPNIEYTFYIEAKQILEIKFREHSTYQYFDVPKELWVNLKEAVSVGSFINRNLKGQYRYCRVS